MCRKISVLAIPEPIQRVLKKAKEAFIATLKGGAIFSVLFVLVLIPVSILNMCWRASQNLSLIPTAEELAEQQRKSYEHNLKLGFDFKPIQIGLGTFLFSLVIIPCVFALGISTYILVVNFSRNRIKIDRNAAQRISYIPPAIPSS